MDPRAREWRHVANDATCDRCPSPVHHERDSRCSTSPDGSRTHQESLLSCALAHIEQDMCDIVDAPLVQFTASKAPPGHRNDACIALAHAQL
eukprot:6321812-Prymnesium_polylepis.1